jgi:tetratricopeptide (TPR) repeat protein
MNVFRLIGLVLVANLYISCNENDIDVAIRKYEQGEYIEAIDILNKSIALDSTQVIAHQYRGLSYYNLKKYDNAQIDFKYYLMHSPVYDTITLFKIGKFFYETKQYKEAVLMFDAIEEDGNKINNLYIYKYRGKSYFELGDLVNSLSDLKEFNSILPNNYLAAKALADYFDRVKNYDSTIYYYTKSIEFNNVNMVDKVLLYYNRGTTYLENEKYSLAIQDYLSALDINYAVSDIHLNLGAAYHLSGKDELGCKHFNIAYTLGEENALNNIKKFCSTTKL